MAQDKANAMDTRRALAILGALAALLPGVMAAEPTASDDPGAEFRAAFEEGVPPVRSARILVRLVKEHPRSEWADDALWVLGEAARRQKRPDRVVYFWQYLMASKPDAELEEFTRSLELYRRSPLGSIMVVLEAEGTAYVPDAEAKAQGRAFFVAKPFNAVPMSVWEELGRSYLRLGKPSLALKAYQRALACAPEHGRWKGRYRTRIRTLAERLPAADTSASEAGPDGPGTAATEQTGASGEHEQQSVAARTNAD